MGRKPKRIPLDREGLRKLGTALSMKKGEFFRAHQKQREFVLEKFPELVDQESFDSEIREIEDLMAALAVLGGWCERSKVKHLGISSFHYDARHLRAHPIIAVYLTGDYPGRDSGIDLQKTFDDRKPIVDWQYWGRALAALESIFMAEVEAMHYEVEIPAPKILTETDAMLALLTFEKASKPSSPDGRKPNSSKNAHHLDTIAPLFFKFTSQGISKNRAALMAAETAGIRLCVSEADANPSTDWVYEKYPLNLQSALNVITKEMSKRAAQRSEK
jgi:hypothetical protein